MLKKIIITILSITSIALLYQVVGNTYRGMIGAKLIGETTAHFLGYYMIAIGYFALLIINIVLLVVAIFHKKKQKKSTKIS